MLLCELMTKCFLVCVEAGLYLAIAMALNAFAQPVTNYLIKRYNMKPNAATNVANVFSGTYSFSPVVGAFVADAFCGRFWTLLFGAVAAFVVSDQHCIHDPSENYLKILERYILLFIHVIQIIMIFFK